MAERGVGTSVHAVVRIDPSTVTCTLRYSNQLRYVHAQFGLRFEIARCHEIPVEGGVVQDARVIFNEHAQTSYMMT